MPFIRQEDIVDGTISKDEVESYKISPGNELNASVPADPFALGFGLGISSPLQVKETAPGFDITWSDEQDISLHDKRYVESIPFYNVVGSPGVFKEAVLPAFLADGELIGLWGGPGTWTLLSATSALNTNRYAHGASGTYSSTTVVGGYNSAGNALSSTEIFNGISFVTDNNLDVSKAEAFSVGTSFAMLYGAGVDSLGNYISKTSVYNGNTWTADVNCSFDEVGTSGIGSYHASLVKEGKTSIPSFLGFSAYFNGSQWSSFFSYTGFQTAYSAGTGSINNGLFTCGVDSTGNFSSYSIIYNGTSFVLGSNSNVSTSKSALCGVGTSAVMHGGFNAVLNANSQLYNGHTWFTAATSSLARSAHTATGTAINANIHGNSNTVLANLCETFNQNTYKRITPENINSAANIGVIYNKDFPIAQRCSIKLSGFITGLPASSSNHFQVVGNVITAYGSKTFYQLDTLNPSNEDFLIGKYDNVNTKLHIFSHFNKTYNTIKRWG